MSEHNGKPLPSKWAQAVLPAISQINPRLDRKIESDDIVVDFVPMRAVEPEGGGLLRPEVATYGKVKKGYTAFRSGDVIMAKITPCMENGKTCVVPDLPGAACFGSTEFHVVRAEQGIDPRWIANYLLQHSTRYAAQRQMAGGVGQMRVPASFLEKLSLPVAPNAEQARILDTLDELLSDLDAGVAALERVRAKLKQYRAAVLKATVEGELTADWREKHPATEHASDLLTRILAERRRRWEEAQLQKFKDAGKTPPKDWKAKYPAPVAPDTTNLPPLAVGWCWATLSQLVWQLRSGSAETSGRVESNFPVLKSSAVRHGRIDFSDLNYYPQSYIVRPENLLQPGDLLITRLSGSVDYVGCCAVVPENCSQGIQYPDRVFCGKLTSLTSATYLTYCFQSGVVRKVLEAAAKSTAGHQRISLSDLSPLALPLPPLHEQVAIVEAVEDQLSVVDHLESDIEARTQSSSGLRQSILRHAFTGQLVPQNLRDEPASELLKRIAAEREERQRQAQAEKNGKPKTKALRKRTAKSSK
jgi:type I restriction enzyme S subunit